LSSEPAEPESSGLPPIDRVEARILGALIEKEATTPEAYPLTANAVVLACNQKNNREPVMELEPGEVGHALRELEQRGLIRSVHGARAQRYEHRFSQQFSVTIKQQAVLSVMLLRGPQTVPELFNRCERLSAFADIEQVRQTLERLMQRTPTLVVKLGRASGQREDRYMHLLCGAVDESTFPAPTRAASATDRPGLEARIEALESATLELRDELERLRQRVQ
jgi:uncharacterized protein